MNFYNKYCVKMGNRKIIKNVKMVSKYCYFQMKMIKISFSKYKIHSRREFSN